MSCVGDSIPSIEAVIETINRCGAAYGGADWMSLAGIGLAAIVLMVAGLAVAFWILKEMTHG
jgi:hypothetical protein